MESSAEIDHILVDPTAQESRTKNSYEVDAVKPDSINGFVNTLILVPLPKAKPGAPYSISQDDAPPEVHDNSA